jgi:opacity protein-like surface antigen
MIKRIAVMAFSLVLLSSLTALAENRELTPHSRSGLYAGIDGSVQWAVTSGDLKALDYNPGESLGINTVLGYRITPWLAAEADYEWLSGFHFRNAPGDMDGYAVGGNIKALVPAGQFQPYALVGLAYVRMDYPVLLGDTARDLGVRFGGGTNYYVTDSIYINLGLDYMLGTGELNDLDWVSFQFGLGMRLM